MKKFMVADLVKQLENEADRAQREEVAWSLGVEPGDVDDDDVENYNSMGGNKGQFDSSVGKIEWLYEHIGKAYLVLMVLETSKGPVNVMYKLSPQMMKDWKDSDSIGEYYNMIIKGNEDIEDPEISCGCGPNPCEPQQIATFKEKYFSIS
jgi:hypothetical protein